MKKKSISQIIGIILFLSLVCVMAAVLVLFIIGKSNYDKRDDATVRYSILDELDQALPKENLIVRAQNAGADIASCFGYFTEDHDEPAGAMTDCWYLDAKLRYEESEIDVWVTLNTDETIGDAADVNAKPKENTGRSLTFYAQGTAEGGYEFFIKLQNDIYRLSFETGTDYDRCCEIFMAIAGYSRAA